MSRRRSGYGNTRRRGEGRGRSSACAVAIERRRFVGDIKLSLRCAGSRSTLDLQDFAAARPKRRFASPPQDELAHYNDDQASANSIGCDEVIYLNERDELVEGSSTNIFVRVAGRLLTPAASCGPLDGCLKRALLEKGECAEAVLHPSDLEKGEVYLGNWLGGLIGAMSFTR